MTPIEQLVLRSFSEGGSNKSERDLTLVRHFDDRHELGEYTPPRNRRRDRGIVACWIMPHERVETSLQIDVETLLERLSLDRPRLREVEHEHHVLVAVRGRIGAEPEPAEVLLEVLLFAPVVVALHHADEERLPEPPRPHEEHEPIP